MKLRPVFTLVLLTVCSLQGVSAGGHTPDPLLFPKDNFTLETVMVKTSSGEKKVTCRTYLHIPYVANPVDRDFQSLNVYVPVEVDGVAVDATRAPILLVIGVGGYMPVNNARSQSLRRGSNGELALAAGYVVVAPGCRGWNNVDANGNYFGKAPAAIVDLKAAVRYIRHNEGVLPGNPEWIFSTGVSAGGALSALLGASGDSRLYKPYLKEIGAAKAGDRICGSACFCPITDLEHADGAYEWMYGTLPARSGPVDQELSAQLKAEYAAWQASLKLQGREDFGVLTADNYDDYLLKFYLIPSANRYLNHLTAEKRKEYLEKNPWIAYTNGTATFAFSDYVAHVGRMKGLPAFDDFEMKQPEPKLFGNRTTDARHFTPFSLRKSTGNPKAQIGRELKKTVNLMNAMYFLGRNHRGCAGHWWIRHGTSDNHTSQTVIVNLATSLENRNREVNTLLYWDAGHGADEDPEEFIEWIGGITGYYTHRNLKSWFSFHPGNRFATNVMKIWVKRPGLP